MSTVRWSRATTAAALVLSAVAFGVAGPAQATANAAAPATSTPAGPTRQGQPVAVARASIEEIRAIASKGNTTTFTMNAGAGVSSVILCTLSIGTPFGGASPGAAVQVDAVLWCSHGIERVGLRVDLMRNGSLVATSGQIRQNGSGLGASAREATCTTGIYTGSASAYAIPFGGPPPLLSYQASSAPLAVGCGNAPPPVVTPVSVTNPGSQQTQHWDSISLQMRATGGNGTFTWSATGLPNGAGINPSTGLITGTATFVGTYSVTVTAVSGGNTGSTSFTWSVTRNPCPLC